MEKSKIYSPGEEGGIGLRLAQLRRELEQSQSEFASGIGLTRVQLSNIEMGRAPLRYTHAALSLMAADSSYDTTPFLTPYNPLWLSGHREWPQQLEWPLFLPPPEQVGLPTSVKFSTFVRDHYELLQNLTSRDPSNSALPEAWLEPYLSHWQRLQERFDEAFDACMAVQEIFWTSAKRLEAGSTRARHLMDKFKKRPMGGAYAEFQENKKTWLTETETLNTLASMDSSLLDTLRDRIKRQAKIAPGAQKRLADYLGANKASVSRWLSGTREPSGEITLRMLRWVEEQEGKTKP